jgi:hypothetical protein
MLLSKEITEVAADLKAEASGRPYVKMLMPAVVSDDGFWCMIIELFEIVLHRRGYVIVKRNAVPDLA